MVPAKVKCTGCGADIEVCTFRKFILCPFCGERTEFEGFDYRQIDWNGSMYSSVKIWTDCPACRSPNMYQGPEKRGWICPDCGYIWREKERRHGVLWFCDECETFLNVQPGFNGKYGTWRCTECCHMCEITKDSIL